MFDMLTIAALADEFARRLTGGRIQKVIQLGDATIGLEIYAEHQRSFLIASADSQNPRLYLSSARVTADPDRVTPLLLLLRKYARGGQVVAVQQPPLERVVRVSIAKRLWSDKNGDQEDEDDEEANSTIVYSDLIIEVMGRHSNIMLVDDTGRIRDAIKRISPEVSRVRPILPGRAYEPPPPQPKQDPRKLTGPAAVGLLRDAAPDIAVADLLVRSLAGFSPQAAREAVFRAFGDTTTTVATQQTEPEAGSRLAEAVGGLLAPLDTGGWEPSVYSADDAPVAFGAVRLTQLTDAAEERYDSMSAAVEYYLAAAGGAQPVRHAQRRERLVQAVQAARDRAGARLHSLEEERARAEAADQWRQMGELIYAYLYQIEPGQTALEVDGLQIKLDPDRSPSENAQAYFDRYRKAQSATEHLPELIEQTKTELAYLEQLVTLASMAEGFEDIEQLRREWEAYSLEQRGTARAKGRRETPPKRPQPLRTPAGDLIYIGRNGRQNELVTFDIAGPDDTWLHARGLPGAHVIIRWAGAEDPTTLERGASLAAYFSSGRSATTVEVDATQRRYVRKIKGTGPGMVTYRNERTLSVRPGSPEALGLA